MRSLWAWNNVDFDLKTVLIISFHHFLKILLYILNYYCYHRNTQRSVRCRAIDEYSLPPSELQRVFEFVASGLHEVS